MSVKLIHVTPNTEATIAYCARVSSSNQENPEFEKLIKYLIKHKHWSPFEMATMCVEINTTRAIAAQILRHKSFNFQEFSQRYSEVQVFISCEARRQDLKNKQNSTDDLPEDIKAWFDQAQGDVVALSSKLYQEAISKGIAKECARFLLPLSTQTRLYMHGTIRSFIHYVDVRTDASTQKEHREIALLVKDIMKDQFPTIAKALGWT